MIKDRKKTPPNDMEIKNNTIFVTNVDADRGVVEAIVSVFGVIDYGRDIIHPGSFSKTISERMATIRVVDQHKTDSIFRVIGQPLTISEIGRSDLPKEVLDKFPSATGGLMTVTQYLLDTPEGLGAFNRIKVGAINEYSIGYEAMDFDYGEVEVDGKKIRVRHLRTIKLWEFSPVVWGMNPATVTTDVKELTTEGPIKRVGDYIHGTVFRAFVNCSSWLYSEGYLSEEEWNVVNTSMTSHLDSFRTELSDDIALTPLTNRYYYDMDGLDPDFDGKAGRVLSGPNAKRIRSAVDELVNVLNTAGVYEEDEKDDDNKGDSNAPVNNEEETPSDELSGSELTLPNDERKKQLLETAGLLDRKFKIMENL